MPTKKKILKKRFSIAVEECYPIFWLLDPEPDSPEVVLGDDFETRFERAGDEFWEMQRQLGEIAEKYGIYKPCCK